MRIQCPYCSGITELEHVDHGTVVECVCSRKFEVSEKTVLEEYTETDNLLPEQIASYPVTGLLGFGGMGKVYLGTHPALNIPVAIKMLRMEYMTDRSACERFIQSARISAKLNHPNIVRVYDCGYLEENVFLIMEYVSGGSARDLLNQNGILQSDHAAFIMLAVCSGLLEAEKAGIVHRDIKPDNIMFDQNGTVKVLDLGLSKISGDKRLNRKTITGSLIALGTAQYMAPEQAVDAANCDSRADIYSIGVTLYQFCTGKLPFESSDQSELRRMHAQDQPIPPSRHIPALNPQMEHIILHCMEKKREDRYNSISELALDLEAFLKNRILPSTLNNKTLSDAKNFPRKQKEIPSGNISFLRYVLLFAGIPAAAMLLAASVFFLAGRSYAGKRLSPEEKIKQARIRSGIPRKAENVLSALARQAAHLAEKNKFGEAAQLYLDYNGPFAEETKEIRRNLAGGFRISEKIFLKHARSGAPADRDSDRNP